MKTPWAAHKARDERLRHAIERVEVAAVSATYAAADARKAANETLSSLRAIESLDDEATTGRVLRLVTGRAAAIE